jgi:hypothetical protein
MTIAKLALMLVCLTPVTLGPLDAINSSKPESVRSKIRSLRDDVAKRIQDIRECMNGDAGTVRAFLSKHIQRIEMDASGGTHYVASGN